MSRWTIEKNGTGIEKSGTGIGKSGTGVEKSGTGIERSETGIEKSGTGIRSLLLVCIVCLLTLGSSLQASNLSPSGSLQIVVDQQSLAVSWIVDGSVFAGVGSLTGSLVSLQLTEVALNRGSNVTEVTGSGSGILVTGTGSGKQVTGTGSGASLLVTGSGSGKKVTGTGSGSSTLVTGSGSGSSRNVTGTGSGLVVQVTGTGSGQSMENTKAESAIITQTGSEHIAITLPSETGIQMEVSFNCNSASVTLLDSNFVTIATFENVNVIGNTGLCAGGFGGRSIESGFVSISN